jgi:hypothetical protein
MHPLHTETICSHRYHFSLNLSLAMPEATEFPLEFVFANFLYWHSRADDVILVLQDDEDVFGITAMYCQRKVLIAPLHVATHMGTPEHERKCIDKAYTTMAILMKQQSKFFNYKSDAAFATIVQLVKNTRAHPTIDALAILHSQTQRDDLRFLRKHWEEADLITPCQMVHNTHTHSSQPRPVRIPTSTHAYTG